MATEIRSFGPIEYEGFSLTGEYEYTPEAPATQDIPGDAAQINIVDIRIKGVDRNAFDLFDEGVLNVLENKIASGVTECYSEGPDFDEWRFEREAA